MRRRLLGNRRRGTVIPLEYLRAYYPFDGNTNDVSGNNFHGTPTNITYATGKSGQAAFFNGTSSFIQLPSFQSIYEEMEGSITFMVKLDDLIKEQRIELNVNSPYRSIRFNAGGANRVGVLVFDNVDGTLKEYSLINKSLDEWCHIGITFKRNDSYKLFIDGILVLEDLDFGNPIFTSGRLNIIGRKRDANVNFLHGLIEGFGGWTTDLNPDQMKLISDKQHANQELL